MPEKGRFPTLDAFVEYLKKEEPFSIHALSPNTLLELATKAGTYVITILNGQEGEVMVTSDDPHLPGPELCTLNGSTLGGTALLMRGIGLGLQVEFHLQNDATFTTPPVQKITPRLENSTSETSEDL